MNYHSIDIIQLLMNEYPLILINWKHSNNKICLHFAAQYNDQILLHWFMKHYIIQHKNKITEKQLILSSTGNNFNVLHTAARYNQVLFIVEP